MGACLSAGDQDDVDSIKNNKLISKGLKNDKKKLESEIRLLLLGAGESGKSTIAKQMKIIHMKGFTKDELISYKELIYSNSFHGMVTLIKRSKDFKYKLDKKNRPLVAKFLDEGSNSYFNGAITPSIAEDLNSLWNDDSIKKTFERRSEFQLSDAVPYYLSNIIRIGETDYVPTEQDVLRSRSKTTGIIETEFEVDGTRFRMVDVGGQRSERKKWMNCFQDVTSVIYCTALSEYDLKLEEDGETNRMKESLQLFSQVCNSKWFTKTAMILFLNKSDLFQEKIKKVPITCCFEDYTGKPDDWQAAASFIGNKFQSQSVNKQVYTQITCATDTGNVKFVFEAVKDIILHQALDASGISL